MDLTTRELELLVERRFRNISTDVGLVEETHKAFEEAVRELLERYRELMNDALSDKALKETTS